jgi:uncharacterized RDD family membrane protein YckC
MSEPAVALVIDSVTGVEVELPVAGPGARSLAFTIDWHIRAICAIAWFVVGTMLYNGDVRNIMPPLEESETVWFATVALPTAALYFLYHPVLEIAMRGRTPGKRMTGVRLVTREGGPPSLGAHLVRNVFRLVDQFPLFYGLGLVLTMVTRNHVRLGDLAAGTLLVYDRAYVTLLEHIRNDSLDAATAEIVNDLLRRWSALEPSARRRLAAAVLAVPPSDDDAALRASLEKLATGGSP